MKSGRRGGHRSRIPRKDRLVAFTVRLVCPAVEVGRNGHLAESVQVRRRSETDQPRAVLQDLLHGGGRSGRGNDRAGSHFPSRAHHGRPVDGIPLFQQEHLDHPVLAVEACRDHPAVVEDEEIP